MKKIIFVASIFAPNMRCVEWADLYQKNGYTIEFWEVGIIWGLSIFNEPYEQYTYKRMKTLKQLYLSVLAQRIKNTIFLFIGTEEIFNLCQAMICVLGGKYCVVNCESTNTCRRDILLEKKIKKTEKHWMDNFMPAYSFLGSRHHVYTIRSNFQLKYGRNIYIHSRDFDEYLMSKNRIASEDIVKLEPYILLIDQNFFDHSDQVNFFKNRKWINDEETFIKEMHDFLDEVEKQFSTKVVVASHPCKAARIEELYDRREIIYGNTCEYIKNAEYVIACCSGAIGYAVLFKKRMLIYTSNIIKRSIFYMEWQLPKARILKANIINISKSMHQYVLEDYLTDVSEYDNYVEYITDDIESEELFKDVILRYLKTL